MSFVYRAADAVLPDSLKSAAKHVVRGCVRMPATGAAINLGIEVMIALMTPISRIRLRTLRRSKGLKVHLGCGAEVRAGWVNIDLGFGFWSGRIKRPAQGGIRIRHDLRRGLPIEHESCEIIYSSHFFEHLEYRYGMRLMRDCYRALQPAGVFRMAMPNFRGLFEAYLRDDYDYVRLIDISEAQPDVERGTESLVDYVNYGVYQFGEHRCIYDERKLKLILERIGFRSVYSSSYRQGLDPDDPIRRRYSFYIEAVK
jgi:SAM-dependent methyltransferase